jgi:hypothetical protein
VWPKINLFHCMRGTAEVSYDDAAAGVGLYNNSSQQHFLVVRDIRTAYQSTSALVARSARPAGPITPVGIIVPVVTDEHLGPGQLYGVNDTSDSPPFDYSLTPSDTYITAYNHEFPLAVLRPGWALEVLNLSQTTEVLSFWWEYVTPEEFNVWWAIEASGG